MTHLTRISPLALFCVLACASLQVHPIAAQAGFGKWTEVNGSAPWGGRAGLRAAELRGRIYLMGGRTPIDPKVNPVPGASKIWDDVWASDDRGKSWKKIASGKWPARAYFQLVTKRGYMYVIGGQDTKVVKNPKPGPPLILKSTFFSDVHRSRDGIQWQRMTGAAPWAKRAGLSCVVHRDEIYVMAGSQNDDSAIPGPNGPPRIYFRDVWKSRDGAKWTRVTRSAPWAARAGAITTSHNGCIYLFGGESGFLCQPVPCKPPYFNDVWCSRDGKRWWRLRAAAEWPARPGHEVVVFQNWFVLFGGFGQSQDPTKPFAFSNPRDVWLSRYGYRWTKASNSPWNATSPAQVKYDFDAIVVRGHGPRGRPAIYTFGGDRETFNFFDPVNYLRVDDEVWSFDPFAPRR